MKLDDSEQAMLAGEQGPARQWAIEQQIAVGNFFDARDMVPVHQVHIMADTESLGDSGVEFLEKFAGLCWKERHCLVPTVTDPRGIDKHTESSAVVAPKRRVNSDTWMTGSLAIRTRTNR